MISRLFDHIAIGDGMVVYGVHDTMTMMESGAVGKIVCIDNIDYVRIKVKNTDTEALSCLYVKSDQASNPSLYRDRETGAVL